jgi:hypothetical protein
MFAFPLPYESKAIDEDPSGYPDPGAFACTDLVAELLLIFALALAGIDADADIDADIDADPEPDREAN